MFDRLVSVAARMPLTESSTTTGRSSTTAKKSTSPVYEGHKLMGPEYSFGFALLIIAPGVLGLFAAAYCLWRHEQSRRGQSLLRRVSSDLLGPLALLVPKAESEQSRPWLRRVYSCSALVFLYALALFAIFR